MVLSCVKVNFGIHHKDVNLNLNIGYKEFRSSYLTFEQFITVSVGSLNLV